LDRRVKQCKKDKEGMHGEWGACGCDNLIDFTETICISPLVRVVHTSEAVVRPVQMACVMIR
jgi:hypothetical protein